MMDVKIKGLYVFLALLVLIFIFGGCRDATDIIKENQLSVEKCWEKLPVKKDFAIIDGDRVHSTVFVANFMSFDIMIFTGSDHYDLWKKNEKEAKRIMFNEYGLWNKIAHAFREEKKLYKSSNINNNNVLMFNLNIWHNQYQWSGGPLFSFDNKYIDYSCGKITYKTFVDPAFFHVYYETNDIKDIFNKIEYIQKKIKKVTPPNGGYYYELPMLE